jgi:hypothetical protein
MPAVGQLVRSTAGEWFPRPLAQCPNSHGHPGPGRPGPGCWLVTSRAAAQAAIQLRHAASKRAGTIYTPPLAAKVPTDTTETTETDDRPA